MKIIGFTQQGNSPGYLVEASGDELMNIAGYTWSHELRESMPAAIDRDGRFVAGAVISVSRSFDYLKKLRDNEAKVRGSADLLRAMAEMVAGALPTTIVPPETPEEPT